MDLIPEEISLRKANNNDCYDIWMWRNAPEARRWSFNKEYIEYGKHRVWFRKKLKDKKIAIYIAENNKKEKIGQVRFAYDRKKKIAYVNTNLNPKFFGKGLGNRLIKSATQTFLKENYKIREVIAEIIEENLVSQKAFAKANYVFLCSAYKNEKKIFILKFALGKSNVRF